MIFEELEVFLGEHEIGTVARGANRESIIFKWKEGYENDGIRLTESFGFIQGVTPASSLASRFFGGYLPEGQQRRAMAEQRSILDDDLFGFLREYGGSLAGALVFKQPKSRASYEKVSETELRRLLKEAVGKQNQGIKDDSRSMIPGFQPKVLMARFDKEWFLPVGNAHSTHILKPERPGNPERIIDEHYAHQLAREVGLANYETKILKAGPTNFLAIERFDREISGNKVNVFHQEDAAQAMSLDWRDDQAKFQNPDYRNSPKHASAYKVAEAVSHLDENPLTMWLEQLVFRVLIGDNDGHAKNVGIMHLKDRDVLSDIYDAVPNLFQQDRISWDLALSIDNEFDHRKISRENILNEAITWGLSKARTRTILDSLFERFSNALQSVDVPEGVSARMIESIDWNLKKLVSGSEIGQMKL